VRVRSLPAAAVLAVLLAAACSGPSRQVATETTAPVAATTAATTAATAATAATTRVVLPSKVLVVVEENHSEGQALTQMPYLRSLAGQYGRTSAYRAVAHPSLPNYLAIAGGSTAGVRDDRGPAAHPLPGPSAFGQALAAHRTARLYAEAMSRPCQSAPAGRYAVKHNPWAYFVAAAERAGCRRQDLPLGTTGAGALHADVAAGRLPNVGMVVPDLCHDGHDCPLRVADQWLQGWLTQVLRGPDFRSGRLAVVVTFDEDDSSTSRNQVLTVVVHPALHHRVVATALSHLSLSRWLSEVAGAAPLRQARTATSLGRAFGLR
jgi:hypothetical protein